MIDGRETATGQVVRGHGVASGAGGDPRFPDGTIALQLPFLRAAVADLDAWLGAPPFPGTINLDFANRIVVIRQPEIRIAAVRWTESFPPENFFLSRCHIRWRGEMRPAFAYIPDPLTKPDHLQAASVLELLCAAIPGLHYGASVDLSYAPEALSIAAAGGAARTA